MSSAIYGLLFVAGTSVSLLAGWQLVAALERVGGRVGLSEGALGMLAALAADAPEITAAVSALAAGNHHVGAGVVIGSNLFNLASLIGVAGIVGGFIALDRRVVRFAGVIAAWVALMALAAATGALSPALTLALSLIVFVPYIAVLTLSPERLDRLARHDRVRGALAGAVIAEETEMQLGNESRRGRATHFDALLALGLTLLVVLASVVMERSATTLGTRAQVPAIVVGALALAAVTSLPNAVAGVYLALDVVELQFDQRDRWAADPHDDPRDRARKQRDDLRRRGGAADDALHARRLPRARRDHARRGLARRRLLRGLRGGAADGLLSGAGHGTNGALGPVRLRPAPCRVPWHPGDGTRPEEHPLLGTFPDGVLPNARPRIGLSRRPPPRK